MDTDKIVLCDECLPEDADQLCIGRLTQRRCYLCGQWIPPAQGGMVMLTSVLRERRLARTGREADTMTQVEEFRRKSWRHLKRIGVRRKTDAQLRKFVFDILAGRIFTSAQIPPSGRLELVFMPLVFGALADWPAEDLADIGIIYEYLDQAGPRSINGCPGFFSMRLMHVDDWQRCLKAIQREQGRREEIEV